MAYGPTYRVPFKRRKKGKTDYNQRLTLLKSGKKRLVVRKTLNQTIIQIAEYDPKGDKMLASAVTKELVRDYGWKGATGNIPAAYLTGYLAGKKALQANMKSLAPDLGLNTPVWGSKIFAALKGFSDAGVELAHKNEVFPSDDRLTGKHISDYAALLKSEDKEKYDKQFSKYLSQKASPEGITKMVEDIKGKITAKFG